MTGPDELVLYGVRVTRAEYVEAYRTYRGHMDSPTMTPGHYVYNRVGDTDEYPGPDPGGYELTVIDDWLLDARLIKDAPFRTQTRALADGLGPEFLAVLLDGTAEEWADGSGPVPRRWQQLQKVYEAWYAYTAVAEAHGDDTARAWMNDGQRIERLRAGEPLRGEARAQAVEGRQLAVTVILRPATEGRWAAEGWWEVTVPEVPDFRMFSLHTELVKDQVVDGLAMRTRSFPERFIVKQVTIESARKLDPVSDGIDAGLHHAGDVDSEETTAWMTENARRMLLNGTTMGRSRHER